MKLTGNNIGTVVAIIRKKFTFCKLGAVLVSIGLGIIFRYYLVQYFSLDLSSFYDIYIVGVSAWIFNNLLSPLMALFFTKDYISTDGLLVNDRSNIKLKGINIMAKSPADGLPEGSGGSSFSPASAPTLGQVPASSGFSVGIPGTLTAGTPGTLGDRYILEEEDSADEISWDLRSVRSESGNLRSLRESRYFKKEALKDIIKGIREDEEWINAAKNSLYQAKTRTEFDDIKSAIYEAEHELSRSKNYLQEFKGIYQKACTDFEIAKRIEAASGSGSNMNPGLMPGSGFGPNSGST